MSDERKLRQKNQTNKNDSQIKDGPITSMSLCSLIIWNISKALQKNPCLDLEISMKDIQYRMQRDALNVFASVSKSEQPEEQHLKCALLAWQRLGHASVDSLYRFVQSHKSELNPSSNKNGIKHSGLAITSSSSLNLHCETKSFDEVDKCNNRKYAHGPVVKLPVDAQIVLRIETKPNDRAQRSPLMMQTNTPCNNTSSKIYAACCKSTGCAEQLALLDKATDELRVRAGKIAAREAERVELLERAEKAWRDLEMSYQKRLMIAEEKEVGLTKEINKTIEERNTFKEACTSLSKKLAAKSASAEKLRLTLNEMDKQVCECGCLRLKLKEDLACSDEDITELHCKGTQLDRDIHFKEDQAQRKLKAVEADIETTDTLSIAAEHAIRTNMERLRKQIIDVSDELLQENEISRVLFGELETLHQEKSSMIDDVANCKAQCEANMQEELDELFNKKQQLNELIKKEIDCRCQMPVDAEVEVKRTPSLVAICDCKPEEKILQPCSCESLRRMLITNLLSDLFGGLQAELGQSGLHMPCHLLKCLEDKHNWDKTTTVMNNLQNYFSKLLVGELDIAIANSIEKYHAQWIGVSCADEAKMQHPTASKDVNEEWEQRAVEQRAKKLATKLAEELFEQRAEKLIQQAEAIVKSGPPPCECGTEKVSKSTYQTACRLDVNQLLKKPSKSSHSLGQQNQWQRTQRDVSRLQAQLAKLQQDSVRRADLIRMEENIAKMVPQPVPEVDDCICTENDNRSAKVPNSKKGTNITNKHTKSMAQDSTKSLNKNEIIKKKVHDCLSVNSKKGEKPVKLSKNCFNHDYTVNVCLCGTNKTDNNIQVDQLTINKVLAKKFTHAHFKNDLKMNTSTENILVPKTPPAKDTAMVLNCTDCKCFNKIPSNKSLDQLLDTLVKWKYEFGNPPPRNFSDKGNRPLTDVWISEQQLNKIKKKSSLIVRQKSYEYKNKNIDSNNTLNDIKIVPQAKGVDQEINTLGENKSILNINKTQEAIKLGVSEQSDDFKKQQKSIYSKKNHFTKNGSLRYDTTAQSAGCNLKKVSALIISENNSPSKCYSATTVSKETNKLKPRTNSPTNEDYFHPYTMNEPISSRNDYSAFLGVTIIDILSKTSSCSLGQTDNKLFISSSNVTEKYSENKNITSNNEVINKINESLKEEEQIHSTQTDKLIRQQISNLEECKAVVSGLKANQAKIDNSQQIGTTFESQCLNSTEDFLVNCVCCNSTNYDNSKKLEVNAFHLLRDHLKEKLKEVKTRCCKTSCFSPEVEEKIYATILSRVKQVISDCANNLTYSEHRKGFQCDESWKRAYGLLEEYLKIKIRRARCLIFSDKQNNVLPEILEKVCNLIENDFQRLRNVCKHKIYNKNFTITPDIDNFFDFLETHFAGKDKKMAQTKIPNSSVKILPQQNSVTTSSLTKNMPCQTGEGKILFRDSKNKLNLIKHQHTKTVSTQACSNLEMQNKIQQTFETKLILPNVKSQGVIYNIHDFIHNSNKKEILQFMKNNDILFNCHGGVIADVNDSHFVKSNIGDFSDLVIIENNEFGMRLEKRNNTTSIDKIDVAHLTTNEKCCCICTKSFRDFNYAHYNDKQRTTHENKNCIPDFEHILDDCRNSSLSSAHGFFKNNSSKKNCDCVTDVQIEKDIVLLLPREPTTFAHHTTNTFEGKRVEPLYWGGDRVRPTRKTTNHKTNVNSPDSSKKNTPSVIKSLPCNCENVPLCHVKMLVRSIAKKIVEHDHSLN